MVLELHACVYLEIIGIETAVLLIRPPPTHFDYELSCCQCLLG